MSQESQKPDPQWSGWATTFDETITTTKGNQRVRVRVDFSSSDASVPNSRLAELSYVAELFESRAKLARVVEKNDLRRQLFASVADIYFTRFRVDLAELGSCYTEQELITTMKPITRDTRETEREVQRRDFIKAKKFYGEQVARETYVEGAKLFDLRSTGGRIPVSVLFADLLAREDGRWRGSLTSACKMTRLLGIESRVAKLPKSAEAGEELRINTTIRVIYGAQLASRMAKVLASAPPKIVALSSPAEQRW